jgi:uncharacterized lipoprotein YmbA
MKAIAAVVFLFGFGLAGCGSILAPQPDPSKFYVLSPAYSPPPTAVSNHPAMQIGLGPIHLPGYLDRREIATQVNQNRIDYSSVDRWSESLDSNFRSVLASDLTADLGNARIVDFPWFQSRQPDYAISINVSRFDREPGGATTLSAHWIIREVAANAALLQGDFLTSTQAQASDTASSVAALSADLAQLSHQLATAVRQVEESGHGSGVPASS